MGKGEADLWVTRLGERTAVHKRAWGQTRRSVLAGLAVTSGGALAACGSAGGSDGTAAPQPSKAPVTLTAMIGINELQVTRFPSEIGQAYKQVKPNVTLEALPQVLSGQLGTTQAVFERLTAMVAGGSPPDIFEAPRHAELMVEKGFTDTTMDALMKRDKYKTDVYNPKEFATRAVYQGKTVQMPWKLGGNSLVMLLNTDLFQKAGVPLPSADLSKAWSWEDMTSAAVKLTRRSGSDVQQWGLNGLAWTIGSWPLLWQADWMSQDLKSVTCDTTDMVDCYTRLHDLHHKHRVVPLPGEAAQLFGTANLFNTGRAAMQTGAVGSWPTYVNAKPEVPIMVVPIPKVKISTPDVNSHQMSILKESKSKGDAWEAIKYMIDEARLPRLTERMPARLDHLEAFVKDTTKASPKVDTKLVLDVARNFVPQSNVTRHLNQDAMLDAINAQLNDLWANKIAPGPMLKALKPQLEGIAARK
ncbi:MAG TPA: extracellular solute-binding protein [Chloroflexota bacterium]|nr:extracellular solute-binding protein [Chloroflexota bacterium]